MLMLKCMSLRVPAICCRVPERHIGIKAVHKGNSDEIINVELPFGQVVKSWVIKLSELSELSEVLSSAGIRSPEMGRKPALSH